VYDLKITIDVRRVSKCIGQRATIYMLFPNHVILYKSSTDQMRNDSFCVIKYNNIFVVHVWAIYVFFLCYPRMGLSGINKHVHLGYV
jgi:hypothetical protein